MIKISEPFLSGLEDSYFQKCLSNNWFTMGPLVEEFEKKFSKYIGTEFALTTNNGTSALHLALVALGIKDGDEVLVPNVTFVASANVVDYCGAKPVFCDILADTWCIDPVDVRKKITKKTKAIMAVHLYGHPADMDTLRKIADENNLYLIEDAAEALGAEINNTKVGAIGDIAAFSFYGNKIITTGEGGMITTNNSILAEKVKLYRFQGMSAIKKYWHEVIGYNYRMTDMQGALGCSQMGILEKMVEKRREVASLYNDKLNLIDKIIRPVEKENIKNVYWLYTIIIKSFSEGKRDILIKELSDRGIETRPVFYPMTALPPYKKQNRNNKFPISNEISFCGVSLPSHGHLTPEDVNYICDNLITLLN